MPHRISIDKTKWADSDLRGLRTCEQLVHGVVIADEYMLGLAALGLKSAV